MVITSGGNRWRIILIATAFNLLFEYALRGVNNLRVQPFLPLVLGVTYFVYFTMLEDLIVRLRLSDYHLMIISFFFGTIFISLISGIIFLRPQALGIDWVSLLYINLVWWGALQAVMTFYLANRLAPRSWDHPRLSPLGWAACVLVLLGVIGIFQRSGLIPPPRAGGGLTALILLIISGTIFWRSTRGAQARVSATHHFQRDRVMDVLCLITVLFFLVSALFFTHDPIRSGTSNVNATALRLVSYYTLGLSLVMLIYRLITRRPSSV